MERRAVSPSSGFASGGNRVFCNVRITATDSVLLHSFDYRETSRIVRLATRELGVISAIARGARRPKNKFGSALDLFTSGVAHLSVNPQRDLHGLTGFDATEQRASLGTSLARFRAASVVSELCLRFGSDDDTGVVFEAATAAFDAIAASDDAAVAGVALAGGWRVIAGLGFSPSLEQCALCHAELPAAAIVTFQHRAGGAVCESCARTSYGGRQLPPDARHTLVAWLAGADAPLENAGAARAHQRLLREFLEEHLGDGRPLRAFVAWEEQRSSHVPVVEPV